MRKWGSPYFQAYVIGIHSASYKDFSSVVNLTYIFKKRNSATQVLINYKISLILLLSFSNSSPNFFYKHWHRNCVHQMHESKWTYSFRGDRFMAIISLVISDVIKKLHQIN